MKSICSLLTIAALSIGSAYAGCGKIDTTEGKLTSFNAETKAAVVSVKGKEKTFTLTPTSKGGEGLAGLVGKKVKVLTSHGKVTEVTKG